MGQRERDTEAVATRARVRHLFIRFCPSSGGWPKHFGPEAPPPRQSLPSLLRFLPHLPPHPHFLPRHRCLHLLAAQGKERKKTENGGGWLDGQVHITPNGTQLLTRAVGGQRPLPKHLCLKQAAKCVWGGKKQEGRVGSLPLSYQNGYISESSFSSSCM